MSGVKDDKMRCRWCRRELEQVPCPDNRPGCLVWHGRPCQYCTEDGGKIALGLAADIALHPSLSNSAIEIRDAEEKK